MGRHPRKETVREYHDFLIRFSAGEWNDLVERVMEIRNRRDAPCYMVSDYIREALARMGETGGCESD